MLRVKAGPGIAITVEAADPAGLDTLEVVSRTDDLRYQTELSRSGPVHKFKRTLAVTDLFGADILKRSSVVLEVTARNTRGELTTVTAEINTRKKK